MAETKRQKLTVKEVHEPKSFGTKGGQKLEFVCDGTKWITWKKSLFPYIVAGAEIDADTETKERPHENGIYIDHIVHEIYIAGKAVSAKQSYQGQRNSPEERASIESQQAAKFTTELWISGKLSDDSAEVKALRDWLLARLGKNPERRGDEPTKEARNNQPEPTKPPLGEPEMRTLGDLFAACKKHYEMKIEEVLRELGVSRKEDIANAKDAWEQIKELKKGPKEQE